MQLATSPSQIRPLGSAEHLFWLLDQVGPKHFATVAEISGATSVRAWQAALDDFQRSDPLLAASIRAGANGPVFRHAADSRIPLRVVSYDETNWQREVEAELAVPFDFQVAPLIRCVLLHKHGRATLILVVHHSLADGIGATIFVNRILQSLDGQPLPRYGIVPPLDDLLAHELEPLRGALPQPVEHSNASSVSAPRPHAARDARPHIATFALTSGMTARLVTRARSERTTVHGALSVAVNRAVRQLSARWRNLPIRTIHPINARHLSECADEAAGVFIVPAITTDYMTEFNAPFWALARAATLELAPARTRDALLGGILAAKGMMDARPSVAAIAKVASEGMAFDVLLTNLGQRTIPAVYRNFRLHAVWGPCLATGFVHDQAIGVITVGDRLRLVHTSYDPVPGLLEYVVGTLESECEPEYHDSHVESDFDTQLAHAALHDPA